MRKTNKRLVSMLLALAMVLAMLPMAVFAADTTTVYFYNANNWSNVLVHYWNSASGATSWPGNQMTDLGNGYWSAEVPSDVGGLLFTASSSGPQTGDQTLPTDGKNCFTGSEWIVYTGEAVEVVIDYYLRGSMNGWAASDANKMAKQADGTYAITMDLAAGSYEFKAAIADWSWSCPSGSNLTLTLDADDTVTFVLDLTANSLTYTLGSGTVVEVEYFLRGSMNEWSTNDKMVKQADGTYAITLSLDAGTYEYKAATADWSFSVPGGDNAVLTLEEAADVTFVLDVAAGTLTNDAPAAEVPEPEYTYYVAGSEGLCGVEWDPASNAMDEIETGIWEITFGVLYAGTYEYKITTGSWETPSYGYGEGNYTVVAKNPCDVTITFNEETKEVTCDVREWGESGMKFQLNADASADDETVDLRMITYVDSLDYSGVTFYITIEGQTATWECEAVYETINVSGTAMSANDIFGTGEYLVTFTLTDIPAALYGSDIQVSAVSKSLDGSQVAGTDPRTVVLSDILA